MPEYLTTQEYAKRFKISDQTVRKMIKTGQLKAKTAGKGYRIEVKIEGEEPMAMPTVEEKQEETTLEGAIKRKELLLKGLKLDRDIADLQGTLEAPEAIKKREQVLAEKEKNSLDFANSLQAEHRKLEELKFSLDTKGQELNTRASNVVKKEKSLERLDKSIAKSKASVKADRDKLDTEIKEHAERMAKETKAIAQEKQAVTALRTKLQVLVTEWDTTTNKGKLSKKILGVLNG